MNKCSNPAHPHCSQWVLPGDTVCASGHPQTQALSTSFDLLAGLRASRSARDAEALAPAAASLRISGYDPRAAGGRQVLRLDLRGISPLPGQQYQLRLSSALLARASEQHLLVPALDGSWRPVYLEFSSKNKEHGQYRIEVELSLSCQGQLLRRWIATTLVLVARPQASLADIQQAFLSTHKNVRISADDAAIARVQARNTGPLDIDVRATNAGIAHLELDGGAGGKQDHAVSTLAWDEDLIEVDLAPMARRHPHPAQCACLQNAAPESLVQRHVRLFALEECLLGRLERIEPEADLLLCHYDADGPREDGLTRRISARHALIRRGRHGFEIEDVSRYGLLLDGQAIGKHKSVPLRLGMQISLTAAIRDVLSLRVTALMPHAIVLHRADQGAYAECFYLMEPELAPEPGRSWPTLPEAGVLPLLFHQHGGFWHRDPASGEDTALTPATALGALSGIPRLTRLCAEAYPELQLQRLAPLAAAQYAADLTRQVLAP